MLGESFENFPEKLQFPRMHRVVPIFLSLAIPFILHGCGNQDTTKMPAAPSMPEAGGARWAFVAGDPNKCRMKAKISGAIASFEQQTAATAEDAALNKNAVARVASGKLAAEFRPFVLEEVKCANDVKLDVKSEDLKATVNSCDGALTYMIHNEKYDSACGSCKLRETGWVSTMKATIRSMEGNTKEAAINCNYMSNSKFRLNPQLEFCSFTEPEKKAFFADARIKCKNPAAKSKYFANEDEIADHITAATATATTATAAAAATAKPAEKKAEKKAAKPSAEEDAKDDGEKGDDADKGDGGENDGKDDEGKEAGNKEGDKDEGDKDEGEEKEKEGKDDDKVDKDEDKGQKEEKEEPKKSHAPAKEPAHKEKPAKQQPVEAKKAHAEAAPKPTTPKEHKEHQVHKAEGHGGLASSFSSLKSMIPSHLPWGKNT